MNDTQLLQSFIDGSESAFRTLVERHLPSKRRVPRDGTAKMVAHTRVAIFIPEQTDTNGEPEVVSFAELTLDEF